MLIQMPLPTASQNQTCAIVLMSGSFPFGSYREMCITSTHLWLGTPVWYTVPSNGGLPSGSYSRIVKVAAERTVLVAVDEDAREEQPGGNEIFRAVRTARAAVPVARSHLAAIPGVVEGPVERSLVLGAARVDKGV